MKKAFLLLLIVVSFAMLLAVESAPSAVVGYVKYPCVAGLNLVALPLNGSLTMASELETANPGLMDQISYWDNSLQDWTTATYLGDFWDGDFTVGNGSVVMINALADFDLYSIGNLYATNAQYSLVSGLNTVMVPLNYSSFTLASEAGNSMGADQISYWDETLQDWTTATNLVDFWDGDFGVSIGKPLMANIIAPATWPAGARGNTQSDNFTTSKNRGGIK